MDEVRGSGSAELLDDGSLEIELDHHRGDDAASKPSARLLQQPARPPACGSGQGGDFVVLQLGALRLQPEPSRDKRLKNRTISAVDVGAKLRGT